MRRLALILLLLPTLAVAEIVDPNGEDNTANWQDNGGTGCNTANCVTHITDNDTSTAICDSSAAAGPTCILIDMATPSANPTTGANAQTVQGSASEHDDANNGTSCAFSDDADPTITVEVYCNGTASGVTPVNTAVSGDAAAFSGTFTFGTTIGTATCAADGSDLQFYVCSSRSGGAPAARRWVAVEELEWDATVAAGGRTRRTF